MEFAHFGTSKSSQKTGSVKKFPTQLLTLVLALSLTLTLKSILNLDRYLKLSGGKLLR